MMHQQHSLVVSCAAALAVIVVVCGSCVGVTSATTAPVPKLPYLAHSFNDLAFHRQLLVKGVRWFKVDIQPASESSCKNYSSWSGGECYKNPGDGVSVCCLALRGDTSDAPHLTAPFNTTDDFLASFNATENAHWYRNPDRGAIYFELDFDVGVPPSSEPVYALYKAFLSSLEALIHDGVQVVTPGFLGYESNVNIDETDVQHQCKEGWPQSPYPYSWWEPSSQAQILEFFGEFTSCPNVPASHRNVNNGTAITCNQGPEMYEVFSSSVTNRGNNSAIIANATAPIMSGLLSTTNGATYAAASWSPKTATSSAPSGTPVTLVCAGSPLESFTALQQLELQHPAGGSGAPVAMALRASTACGQPSGSQQLAVAWANGSYALFPLSTSSTGVAACGLRLDTKPACTGSVPAPAGAAGVVVHDIDLTDAGVVAVVSPTASGGGGGGGGGGGDDATAPCPLQLAVVAPGGSSPTWQCVQTAVAASHVQASVSVASSTAPGAAATASPGAGHEGLVVYADTSASPPEMFAASVVLDSDGSVATIDAGALAQPPVLDMGSHPHVAVQWVGGGTAPWSLMATEVHTDAMCQCGEAINNGAMNHCDINPRSSSPLRSVSNTLGYSYGTLQAWRSKIQGGGFMSACDTCILHGKYDSGGTPSAALLPTPVLDAYGEQVVRVVELHDGGAAASPLAGICGAPVPKGASIVLDEFHVPAPSTVMAACQAAQL